MSPMRFAAIKAGDRLNLVIGEIKTMFGSAKFKEVLSRLDSSVEAQQTAIKNIGAFLKESGVKAPKGVSFAFDAKTRALQITITGL